MLAVWLRPRCSTTTAIDGSWSVTPTVPSRTKVRPFVSARASNTRPRSSDENGVSIGGERPWRLVRLLTGPVATRARTQSAAAADSHGPSQRLELLIRDLLAIRQPVSA